MEKGPIATARDPGAIHVVNASTHNLKNIHLQIPRGQLVVVTGPSGSGKSSLAVDTIFAEGQRQYLESLSIYSRQFFKQLPRAEVELIEGLQPTVCLDQSHGVTNRRSTVGTTTEIYDYLRLLMARVGRIHCYQCGRSIRQLTAQQIRDRLLNFPERTKIMILAPQVTNESGDHQSVLKRVRRERLVRVRIDGEVTDIEQTPVLHPTSKHTIEAITDRIIIRDGIEKRLLEAIEFADRLAGGRVIISHLLPNAASQDWSEETFSTRYACPDCDIQFEEIQPRTFSFNSPHGACKVCQGLGMVTVEFEQPLVVPDRRLSLSEQAVVPWRTLSAAQRKKRFSEIAPQISALGWSLDRPLNEMSESQWNAFWCCGDKSQPGLMMILAKELATTVDEDREDELREYQSQVVCDQCQGCRLNGPARSVFFAGKNMGAIVDLPIENAQSFFEELELADDQAEIAEPIVKEILHRLRFLNHVGVGYLSLGRGANTLSGGEHQRVRLATSVGSGLTNVCYILDEPSIGLHQRDNDRLIETIRELQRSGNSILLIEHDEATIRAADQVIDIGPAAGQGGGRLVAQGTPSEICECTESLTGDYLAGRRKIATPQRRRQVLPERSLKILGAAGRNLKSIDVEIPLDVMVCVTGVSGSGKSTLINQTLAPAILRELGRVAPRPQLHRELQGCERISSLIVVDQKAIGKSPRGCPATVSGIFDELRKLFASTRKAKQLGFGVGRFSFNSKTGWCPECRGMSVKRIEMNFMPDFFVVCDSCQGKRFNLQTLTVKFNDQSIADVLAMSIEYAREFFDGFQRIAQPLQSLLDVGLGYLRLGQSTTTLSGGEGQRLKLATELARPAEGHTLYVLDEPTTGLHFEDVRILLDAMNRLVDRGNSMIVIEHNLDVIRCADWIVDLGPEGGEQGGELLACGTPESVAGVERSNTGKYLKQLL